MVTVREACADADIDEVRRLFLEYAFSLGIDLSFQDFEGELAALPGLYAGPAGCLLLAYSGGCAVGCVAVRAHEPGVCEMKRLYVKPDARALGAGRALAAAAIEFARHAGYRAMRLDTLPGMLAARALYRQLGFREIPPYRYNPVPGTSFMELTIREEPSRGGTA
jgi:putative acetyltransferase